MIQYCEAPVMESNGHGVLDTPLSRSMTTSCRAALCATHPALVPANAGTHNPRRSLRRRGRATRTLTPPGTSTARRMGPRVRESGDDVEVVLNPQIRRLHLLVVSKLRATAVHDHVAAFQHIGALHQRQRAADVLLHQQNGRAHLVNFADL